MYEDTLRERAKSAPTLALPAEQARAIAEVFKALRGVLTQVDMPNAHHVRARKALAYFDDLGEE